MAAFPAGTKFEWSDLGWQYDPVVERSPMERGIAKQRRVTSDVRGEMPITVVFDTKAEANAFDTWFFTTINGGQDFFDFDDPVSGATIQARIVGGQRGPRKPDQQTLEGSRQSFKIEAWRSTW